MRGGGKYTVRPIHPDDAEMLQELVQNLSSESRCFRFVSSMKELPWPMLSRLTLIDCDREMALVAIHRECKDGPNGESVETKRTVGVSRSITNFDPSSCDFSLVANDFNGKGLSTGLYLYSSISLF